MSVVGFFSSPQMKVMDVSLEEVGIPLLVCYDSSSRRHSIWSVQPSTREVCVCVCVSSMVEEESTKLDCTVVCC